MTIITKPISEKKEAKLVLPLVENEQATAPQPSPDDVEAQNVLHVRQILLLRKAARRVSTTTTLCLLLGSLAVVGIGIIGGTYLYRQYIRTPIFKGWCNIPYESPGDRAALNGYSDDIDMSGENRFMEDISNYFHEEVELDVDNEEYERIDVPDFKNGRRGRFIHDFNTNTTGIIDSSAQRCFIMPMNRNAVLPPKSLYDLIQKMWEGYYNVDTKVIRETMRVVVPPVTDKEEVGIYIAKECAGMPIYRLEKYVGGVVKRSADAQEDPTYANFAGKGILEIAIVNMHEAEAAEGGAH